MSNHNVVQNTKINSDTILFGIFMLGLIFLITGIVIKYNSNEQKKNNNTTTYQVLMYLGCFLMAPKAVFFAFAIGANVNF
jgi:uncharacterized membrane protein